MSPEDREGMEIELIEHFGGVCTLTRSTQTVCARQDVTMETHRMCSGVMDFRLNRSEDEMNETVEGEQEVSDPVRTREDT